MILHFPFYEPRRDEIFPSPTYFPHSLNIFMNFPFYSHSLPKHWGPSPDILFSFNFSFFPPPTFDIWSQSYKRSLVLKTYKLVLNSTTAHYFNTGGPRYPWVCYSRFRLSVATELCTKFVIRGHFP